MTVTQLLSTIIVGLFVGVLAKLFSRGPSPGGFVVTTLLGIGGSFVGGYVGGLLGFYAAGLLARIITSVIGAMLILWLYRLFAGSRQR